MTRKDFYRYIDRPALLTAATLPELARIVEAFPCFHAARMLYLKNLALVGDLRLKSELERMAIHVPDRARLFLLLTDERLERSPHTADAPAHHPEADEAQGARVEPFESSASTDYLRWLTVDATSAPSPEPKMRHQDLIDSFIAHGSERIDKHRLQRAVAEPEAVTPPPSVTPKAESTDTSYFTETLAHVYIRQKRYAKALEIIRGLSEKHPERNIYFADQIRFLEKLIEHSRNKSGK